MQKQETIEVKSDPAGICSRIRMQKLSTSAPEMLSSHCGSCNSCHQYFAFQGIAIIGLQWTRCLLLMLVRCWLTINTSIHPSLQHPASNVSCLFWTRALYCLTQRTIRLLITQEMDTGASPCAKQSLYSATGSRVGTSWIDRNKEQSGPWSFPGSVSKKGRCPPG